jgi:hypothetical protein
VVTLPEPHGSIVAPYADPAKHASMITKHAAGTNFMVLPLFMIFEYVESTM